MSTLDLHESGKRKSNVAHLAAMVSLANVDGAINDVEKKV